MQRRNNALETDLQRVLAELSIPDRYAEAQQCFNIGKYSALA